jgi:putative FmdB family regulatory protein
MATYLYQCRECGAPVDIERPMAAAEAEAGLAACAACGGSLKRIYTAPGMIVSKQNRDGTVSMDSNPVERQKREADMPIMVPREQYLNRWREQRAFERSLVVPEDMDRFGPPSPMPDLRPLLDRGASRRR